MCALVTGVQTCALPISDRRRTRYRARAVDDRQLQMERDRGRPEMRAGQTDRQVDRMSVVSGKRVTVRVELGGRRIITKKKKSIKDELNSKIYSEQLNRAQITKK